jgi:protein-S-isoprenylcysteine O-methyltransferase Ste14
MNDLAKAVRRAILSLVVCLPLLAAVMFVPAGIGWRQGWLFLAVFALEIVLLALYIWRTNPEVFVARSKMQKGTKGWDRVLFYLIQALILAIFPLAGLDHWSAAPPWVIVLGYVMLTAGMAGTAWVMRVNKFAEMSVRIQTERGHQVVDTGPYVFVRHPFYVATFPLFGGIPLALGSYWALIPAAITGVALIVRTAWEDRTLQNELPGYREYAARVRYRLLPGVW